MTRCTGCGKEFWTKDESGFVVYPAYCADSDICTNCADYDRQKDSRRYDDWMVRYKSSDR